MPDQITIDSPVVTFKEVNGIAMGVFADETTFLNGRCLSRLCDISPSTLTQHTSEWSSGKRSGKLARFLVEHNYNEPQLF